MESEVTQPVQPATQPDPSVLIAEGKRSLRITSEALGELSDQLDERFADVVELILGCRGHVVVSGAGTSSTMAARLAHLLTVCGAPAFYLNPSDGSHGGSATVTPNDVLIAISKGGESDELNTLVRVACERGAPVVAMTQNASGTLSTLAQYHLIYRVPDEVDAQGYIALGSSLAAGAVGDAVCFAILLVRGFDADDFRLVHPGGAVGKALGADRA